MRTWLGHWLTDLSRGRFIMKLTKFKLSSPSLAWASSKVVSSLFCGYQFAFFKEEPKSCISFRPHKIPKGPWSRAEVVPYGWVPLVVLQNSFTTPPPFLSMTQPPTPTHVLAGCDFPPRNNISQSYEKTRRAMWLGFCQGSMSTRNVRNAKDIPFPFSLSPFSAG